MSNGWTANLVNLFILIMLPIYIGVHFYFLPEALSYSGTSDTGFISIITLTFIAATFLTLLTLAFSPHLNSSKITAMAMSYIVLIYFLREADLHRLLTLEHVTRLKFYSMPEVPLWQKICAATIFIIFVIFVIYVLFKYTRTAWSNIRDFEPWGIAFILWLLLLLVSQLCDRSGLNGTLIGRIIEECCECWAAIFMLLATVQLIPTLKKRKPLQYGVTAYDVMRNRGITDDINLPQ